MQMTGIERLRELIDAVDSKNTLWSITSREYDQAHGLTSRSSPVLRDVLADIAYQIERETTPHERRDELADGHATDVSMSARDLLPQEDREAVAWVREHGGIEGVKEKWTGHVPRSSVKRMVELHEKKRDRLKAHALWLERKCHERRERIKELDKAIAEMCSRLMPEGMEWLLDAWPRFEDDAPLVRGDEVMTSDGAIRAEELCLTICDRDGGVTSIDFGERVKRPAPKVLDADGAEIELGDDLYSVEGGLKLHVGVIDTRNGKIATAEMYALDKWADPAMYTHHAPVLAADGKPLREGETVYHVADGRACVVREVREAGAVVEPVDGRPCGRCRADYLTHERPDSWERLEEDASLDPFDYCVGRGVADMGADHLEDARVMARDLVRRAKALAGDA